MLCAHCQVCICSHILCVSFIALLCFCLKSSLCNPFFSPPACKPQPPLCIEVGGFHCWPTSTRSGLLPSTTIPSPLPLPCRLQSPLALCWLRVLQKNCISSATHASCWNCPAHVFGCHPHPREFELPRRVKGIGHTHLTTDVHICRFRDVAVATPRSVFRVATPTVRHSCIERKNDTHDARLTHGFAFKPQFFFSLSACSGRHLQSHACVCSLFKHGSS